jgi:hypothetical protein
MNESGVGVGGALGVLTTSAGLGPTVRLKLPFCDVAASCEARIRAFGSQAWTGHDPLRHLRWNVIPTRMGHVSGLVTARCGSSSRSISLNSLRISQVWTQTS